MNERIFEVVGIDDLEGLVFARCTTHEKALKAKTLLEAEGLEDMLDIVPIQMLVDVVEIDGKLIEL